MLSTVVTTTTGSLDVCRDRQHRTDSAASAERPGISFDDPDVCIDFTIHWVIWTSQGYLLFAWMLCESEWLEAA